jgi:hypothetical protein
MAYPFLLSALPAEDGDGLPGVDLSVRLDVPVTAEQLDQINAIVSATLADPAAAAALQGMLLADAAALVTP